MCHHISSSDILKDYRAPLQKNPELYEINSNIDGGRQMLCSINSIWTSSSIQLSCFVWPYFCHWHMKKIYDGEFVPCMMKRTWCYIIYLAFKKCNLYTKRGLIAKKTLNYNSSHTFLLVNWWYSCIYHSSCLLFSSLHSFKWICIGSATI